MDYDPTLIKVQDGKTKNGASLEKYAYENKTGDRKQYFPEELTEETPILMEYGEYQIRLLPTETVGKSATAQSIDISDASVSNETEIASVAENAETTEEITALATTAIEVDPVAVEKETITDIYEKEKTIPLKAVYPTSDENVSF